MGKTLGIVGKFAVGREECWDSQYPGLQSICGAETAGESRRVIRAGVFGRRVLDMARGALRPLLSDNESRMFFWRSSLSVHDTSTASGMIRFRSPVGARYAAAARCCVLATGILAAGGMACCGAAWGQDGKKEVQAAPPLPSRSHGLTRGDALIRRFDLNSDGKIDSSEAELARSKMRRESSDRQRTTALDPLTGLPREAGTSLGASAAKEGSSDESARESASAAADDATDGKTLLDTHFPAPKEDGDKQEPAPRSKSGRTPSSGSAAVDAGSERSAKSRSDSGKVVVKPLNAGRSSSSLQSESRGKTPIRSTPSALPQTGRSSAPKGGAAGDAPSVQRRRSLFPDSSSRDSGLR